MPEVKVRKRKLSKKTQDRTLALLWDVKRQLDLGIKVRGAAICRQHRVSNTVWTVMLQKGIVSKSGGRYNLKYKWETRDPSTSMATAVLNAANRLQWKRRQKKKAAQTEDVAPEADLTKYQQSGTTNVNDIPVVEAEVVRKSTEEPDVPDFPEVGPIATERSEVQDEPIERILETTVWKLTWFGIRRIKIWTKNIK